jgi:hypothetical protein
MADCSSFPPSGRKGSRLQKASRLQGWCRGLRLSEALHSPAIAGGWGGKLKAPRSWNGHSEGILGKTFSLRSPFPRAALRCQVRVRLGPPAPRHATFPSFSG